MTKMDMVEQALDTLGEDVPAKELCDFVEKRYDTIIDPKYVPIMKAAVQDKRKLEESRKAARAAEERRLAEEKVLRGEAA